MNRKNLTAAVLAGLAGAAGIVGSAQAVNINPDGLGQVLIYPYYTTNGFNQTLLSVVNTTNEAKAVKVRFKEGKNSREVLDFNLYMSPWDVWTAALSSIDGIPFLSTADTTCTVPYIYGNGGTQAFLPWAMNDTGVPDEYGDISRATEGYFEMIEMGVLTNDSENSALAALHVDGEPLDCQQLVDAWTVFDDKDNLLGYWLHPDQGPLTDIEAPIGGLFGGAAIVNVLTGYMASYDAKAINAFAADAASFKGPLHNPPGDSSPSLNSGDVFKGSVFVNGLSVDSLFGKSIDAVSYVFMHDTIMNEYTTEMSVLAGTEWVMTFPTKSYYVYPEESGSTEALAPFTTVWDGEGACEVVVLATIWDREEQTIINPTIPGDEIPPIVSPRPPGQIDPTNPIIPFELCYETSVISFGENRIIPKPEGNITPILGSANFHEINNEALGFEYGWARLNMDNYPYDRNGNGRVDFDNPNLDDSEVYDTSEADLSRDPLGNLEGLPVTGFSVNRFLNFFTGPDNQLANYGGIYQHKATRKLTSGIVNP
jgi:hypothetical protein